jgi:hypothetical protein
VRTAKRQWIARSIDRDAVIGWKRRIDGVVDDVLICRQSCWWMEERFGELDLRVHVIIAGVKPGRSQLLK